MEEYFAKNLPADKKNNKKRTGLAGTTKNRARSRTEGWVPDSDAKMCQRCDTKFTLINRRHHCRHCGKVVCGGCSGEQMPLSGDSKPVRACDTCASSILPGGRRGRSKSKVCVNEQCKNERVQGKQSQQSRGYCSTCANRFGHRGGGAGLSDPLPNDPNNTLRDATRSKLGKLFKFYCLMQPPSKDLTPAKWEACCRELSLHPPIRSTGAVRGLMNFRMFQKAIVQIAKDQHGSKDEQATVTLLKAIESSGKADHIFMFSSW